MNFRHFLPAWIFILTAAGSVHSAVFITNFGADTFYLNPVEAFLTANQTADSLEISGESDVINSFSGNPIPSSIDISGNTEFLGLTGTYTGTATNTFSIELTDSEGATLEYFFDWNSFPHGVQTTVYAPLSSPSVTNASVEVIEFRLMGPSPGVGEVHFVMNNLVATAYPLPIPEPTATWLALLALGGFLLNLRRRKEISNPPHANSVRV